MAGAQFNAKPQLTDAVNGLVATTEASQGRLLPCTIKGTEEDKKGGEWWERYAEKNAHPFLRWSNRLID